MSIDSHCMALLLEAGLGSEAGLLKIYDFPGIQAGGDGSEGAGRMGAGV